MWETTAPNHPKANLHVYVRNVGRGPAEHVEVRFDTIQSTHLYNESGNGTDEVEQNYVPARFTRPEQVLNAGEEWCVAMLTWVHGLAQPPDDTTAKCRASANRARS